MRQFAKYPAFVTVWVLSYLVPSPQGPQLRADEAGQFLREAPAQWSEYASQMARLQGRVETKLTLEGRVVDQSIAEIKQNAKYKMLVHQRSAAQRPESATRGDVKAYNGHYAFNLWRSAADQPWLIASVEGSGNASAFDMLARGTAKGSWLIEGRLVALRAQPLERLTSDKAFRILEAATTDKGYLTVRFECRHPMEERPFMPVQAGQLVVDPTHYYCLRSADLEGLWAPGPSQTHVAIEYSISAQGLPIPLSIKEESKTKTSTGESLTGRETRYELHDVAELPSDDEFTLSAFGFPEPESPASNTHGLLWLIVIGILCLVAGCAFRFLLGKRNVRGAAS